MTDDMKARLLAGGGGEDTAKVETHAGIVTVRRLTRMEVLQLNMGRELGVIDVPGFEQKMVSLAMVDPPMTETDVKVWQETESAGGALADITDKISEISGLAQGAQKSRVQGAADRPGPGV